MGYVLRGAILCHWRRGDGKSCFVHFCNRHETCFVHFRNRHETKRDQILWEYKFNTNILEEIVSFVTQGSRAGLQGLISVVVLGWHDRLSIHEPSDIDRPIRWYGQLAVGAVELRDPGRKSPGHKSSSRSLRIRIWGIWRSRDWNCPSTPAQFRLIFQQSFILEECNLTLPLLGYSLLQSGLQ